MPLACSRRHLGGSEPMHRARQFSQSFLGGIFEERPAQMDMEKPPAWFHWSFLFLVNLAALWFDISCSAAYFFSSSRWVASHHAKVAFVLGASLVLPLARVPLLKLQKQGARNFLPSCACHLAHVRPDLCSKGGCARITTLGQPPASRV